MTFRRCFPVRGDLELRDDGRDIVLVAGRDKVAQSITVGAQIFKGSWRYDRQVGIPYFQDIMLAGPQADVVRRRFVDFLSTTDGVTSVDRLTLRFENASGIMNVDFSVTCDDSSTLTSSLNFEVN